MAGPAELPDKYREADASLVEAARGIRILSPLSWPKSVQGRFLEQWRSGNRALPRVSYDTPDYTEKRAALAAIRKRCSGRHPVARFLRDTAQSYEWICELLEAAGTDAMSPISQRIYGAPGHSLSAGAVSNVDAARHFLDIAIRFDEASGLREPEYCLSADVLKREMEPRLAAVFGQGTVAVEIDDAMASKAAAGAKRVRLRSGTCFSEYDLEQLLQHEAFVHSLTALNGREQPHLKSLSLGSPRTTLSQEGLATFSELVTGAIDIKRMERIALRVIAIEKALSGADFIEVFEFFLESGQEESESYNSAMRVFRGAPLGGGHAFTKDVVYVHGLMEVHTFFRWALLHKKLELCQHLFAGRMTIDDAVLLEPLFESGLLVPPRYLPPWLTRTNGLAGYLAFSVFANRIRIESLHQGHSFNRLEELSV